MSEPVAVPTVAPCSARRGAAAHAAWSQRLARFSLSGLTPAQFCAEEGVSLPSFYSWKRRLAAQAANSAAPEPDAPPGPRLLPVRWPSSAVELVLPSGAILRLAPGCDLDFVRSLLQALGGASC